MSASYASFSSCTESAMDTTGGMPVTAAVAEVLQRPAAPADKNPVEIDLVDIYSSGINTTAGPANGNTKANSDSSSRTTRNSSNNNNNIVTTGNLNVNN